MHGLGVISVHFNPLERTAPSARLIGIAACFFHSPFRGVKRKFIAMTGILEMPCASDGVNICHHEGIRKAESHEANLRP
jgi:hypothetical protein